jgi:N-acetylmuramoyl-L-alanine amidase
VLYDKSPTPPRRSRRRNVAIAVAALGPTTLAGWFVWQGLSGPDGAGSPKGLPLPSRSTAESEAGSEAGSSPALSLPQASTPSPTTSPSGREEKNRPSGPLAGKVVAVDPGHNSGNFRHTREINRLVDIGTNRKECDTTGTSTNAGYTEAEFTFDVSQRLRTLLEKQGATVTFTHTNDRPFGPCVDERAQIGNKAKADAVISVHADGSAVGNRGFHVILPALVKAGAADTTNIVGPSRDLGERIAGKFVRATGSAPSNYVGDGTGLDVRKDLGGLNLSTVPKVFIECGNMRDPKDAALLTSASWRQKAAQGMADGISSYLHR